MIKCYLNAGQLNLTKGKVSKSWHCSARGWHLTITGDEQADTHEYGKQSILFPLLCTQMHNNRGKAPSSQALKKFTCFGSLDASLTCLGY